MEDDNKPKGHEHKLSPWTVAKATAVIAVMYLLASCTPTEALPENTDPGALEAKRNKATSEAYDVQQTRTVEEHMATLEAIKAQPTEIPYHTAGVGDGGTLYDAIAAAFHDSMVYAKVCEEEDNSMDNNWQYQSKLTIVVENPDGTMNVFLGPRSLLQATEQNRLPMTQPETSVNISAESGKMVDLINDDLSKVTFYETAFDADGKPVLGISTGNTPSEKARNAFGLEE